MRPSRRLFDHDRVRAVLVRAAPARPGDLVRSEVDPRVEIASAVVRDVSAREGLEPDALPPTGCRRSLNQPRPPFQGRGRRKEVEVHARGGWRKLDAVGSDLLDDGASRGDERKRAVAYLAAAG